MAGWIEGMSSDEVRRSARAMGISGSMGKDIEKLKHELSKLVVDNNAQF